MRQVFVETVSPQLGKSKEVLLHETAVSWLRKRLTRSTPKKCWEESREEYGRRLKRCCEEVNKECDVEGLCRDSPQEDEASGRERGRAAAALMCGCMQTRTGL